MDTLIMFLLFVFGSIGMTKILVDSKIFRGVRSNISFLSKKYGGGFYRFFYPFVLLDEVLQCYQCTGFWVGIFSGWVILTHNFPIVIFCGCASSFLSEFTDYVVQYLMSQTTWDLPENGEE